MRHFAVKSLLPGKERTAEFSGAKVKDLDAAKRHAKNKQNTAD